jgi:hypothetical protein
MKDWLSNGLTMWAVAPEARARFSSNGSKVPASSITGVCDVDGSERIAWATSYPVFPGIMQSAITRSGRSSRALLMASTPLSTMVTAKSSVENTMPMAFRMVMESSATRTLLGIVMSFEKRRRSLWDSRRRTRQFQEKDDAR